MSSRRSEQPLRERKRAATRKQLLNAALELFGARGYEDTTMDDIAERADVSRATAYNYFPRKEAFLLAWVEQRRAVIAGLLAREQDEEVGTVTRLEHALMSLADQLEADADANRALVRAWVQAGISLLPGALATAQVFAETIRYGQSRGELQSDLDAGQIGQVLLDAYYGALIRWAATEHPGPDAGELLSLKNQLRTILILVARSLNSQSAHLCRSGAHAESHHDDEVHDEVDDTEDSTDELGAALRSGQTRE